MHNKRLCIYPIYLFELFGDDRKPKARRLNYTCDWSLEMSITASFYFLDYDLQPGNCRVATTLFTEVNCSRSRFEILTFMYVC